MRWKLHRADREDELGPVGFSEGKRKHTGNLVPERSGGMGRSEVSGLRTKEKSGRVSWHKGNT